MNAAVPSVGRAASSQRAARTNFGELLTLLFSFSLWIPGLGVPAGATHGVQLAELMSAPLALFLFATRKNAFPPRSIVAVLAIFTVVLNWLVVFIVNRQVAQSGAILGYYLAIAFPTLICGVLVFQSPKLTNVFIRGAIAGAAFTAVLCLMQAVLPKAVTDFRNNLSFRLPPQGNRTFGLFPEASIAAGTLTFAIGVALAGLFDREVRERYLEAGPLKGKLWVGGLLGLFIAALLSTRSSSVLVMLPILLGVSSLRFFRGSLGKKLGYASLGAILLAAGGAFYYFEIYSTRLENSAAVYSGSERLVSIVGAYFKLRDSDFLGAGLGANNDIADYASRAAGWLELPISGEIQGVNSFVFGRCLEEGLVMIAVWLVVIYQSARFAFVKDRDPRNGVMVLLAVNTLFNALWIAGYRGLLMYWLLIPLAFSLKRDSRTTALVKPPL
ncbi:MAG TPA: hypothetical protein VH062_33160 [Polyangiaceae bacterium]|jgi:hypothetical protein|nr:hypothetical protein [Polyangiaceae bacterium]